MQTNTNEFVCLCEREEDEEWTHATLSTNVLSLSGISRGIVVLTSTIADKGTLTFGLED